MRAPIVLLKSLRTGAAILSLLVGACTTMQLQTDAALPSQSNFTIKIGSTTRAMLLAVLGPPIQRETAGAEEVWRYSGMTIALKDSIVTSCKVITQPTATPPA
jgi:hypothetical protein